MECQSWCKTDCFQFHNLTCLWHGGAFVIISTLYVKCICRWIPVSITPVPARCRELSCIYGSARPGMKCELDHASNASNTANPHSSKKVNIFLSSCFGRPHDCRLVNASMTRCQTKQQNSFLCRQCPDHHFMEAGCRYIFKIAGISAASSS